MVTEEFLSESRESILVYDDDDDDGTEVLVGVKKVSFETIKKRDWVKKFPFLLKWDGMGI
jgi:hypothetical protein